MGNRVIVLVVAGLVLLGGGVTMYVVSRSLEEPAPAVRDTAPAASPATTPAPVVEASPAPSATPTTAKPAAASPAPAAAPTTGTLVIESDVPDTTVFLDRVFLGTAPFIARDVAPGQHQLKLVAAGYESYAETIDVVAGPRTVAVKFKEIRLDASLAVIHKHAMGSCTGTLRATPQGLTYDTSNKGDAFTVALTGLDTFTMDYLEKTLKLKVKDGKSYNFTDPEANVNRLFLFHQEVEKVRQRILSGK